ncbi:Ceramide kinase [Merluccius polli]|uniref:Ceramide kinase n=1 Tax=Merluccius polli TaxID=89951 RepID=A0AA47N0T7_MERPO|nr:Ceramide kinase [Merluccius polli]
MYVCKCPMWSDSPAGWRCRDVTFVCPEAAAVQPVGPNADGADLRPGVSSVANRPRRLLVYINPYSGKKRGERIYQHKVAPLFSSPPASLRTSSLLNMPTTPGTTCGPRRSLQNYDGWRWARWRWQPDNTEHSPSGPSSRFPPDALKLSFAVGLHLPSCS